MRELEGLIGVIEAGCTEAVSYPDLVIYAGQSARRRGFLDGIFPDIPILSFSVDPEPQTSDMPVILEDKLIKGFRYLASLDGQVKTNKIAIVAADTRTIVPFMNNGLRMESLGKPKEEGEVVGVFEEMSQVGKSIGDDPYYEVSSISGAVSTESKQIFTSSDRTRITLHQDALSYLKTTEGFQRYVDLFHSFYRSGAYEREGMPRQALTDLSAGLSLPVLIKLGAVKSIDGQNISNTENLRKAFFTVAVGVQPEVVKAFNPNVTNLLNDWEWLNQVISEISNE